MRDAINEFVKFISDDPLMLGLCLAIVALVILFILVLIFGGKNKEDKEDNIEDNTKELLKNDFSEESLKSTQEFTMESLKPNSDELQTQRLSTIDEIAEDETQRNAPISVDEALNLKNQMADNFVKDTIPVPIIDNSNVVPVEIPEIENMTKTEKEIPSVVPVLEEMTINSNEQIPVVKDKISEIQPTPEPINKIEPEIHANSNQPFSSVYVAEKKKDEPKVDYASPIALATTNAVENKEDDIDLPKLKTDDNNSLMNNLTGEMFTIK